jgi:hypothetical protein
MSSRNMNDPQSSYDAPDTPRTWLGVAHVQACSLLRNHDRQRVLLVEQRDGLAKKIAKLDAEKAAKG